MNDSFMQGEPSNLGATDMGVTEIPPTGHNASARPKTGGESHSLLDDPSKSKAKKGNNNIMIVGGLVLVVIVAGFVFVIMGFGNKHAAPPIVHAPPKTELVAPSAPAVPPVPATPVMPEASAPVADAQIASAPDAGSAVVAPSAPVVADAGTSANNASAMVATAPQAPVMPQQNSITTPAMAPSVPAMPATTPDSGNTGALTPSSPVFLSLVSKVQGLEQHVSLLDTRVDDLQSQTDKALADLVNRMNKINARRHIAAHGHKGYRVHRVASTHELVHSSDDNFVQVFANGQSIGVPPPVEAQDVEHYDKPTLQAIVPGLAWIKGNAQAATMPYQLGDTLPNGHRITNIDADAGRVVLDNNQTIS